MRARNIKPGFWVNEDLGRCDPQARLLFAGLWCLADRQGRLQFRPARWRAELFPYDTDCDVYGLFQQLLDCGGLVQLYEIEGVQYVEITNFLRHQTPHRNEKASVIPAPAPARADQGQTKDRPRTDQGQTKDSPGTVQGCLNPDSRILIPESSSSPARATGDEDEQGTSFAVSEEIQELAAKWEQKWREKLPIEALSDPDIINKFKRMEWAERQGWFRVKTTATAYLLNCVCNFKEMEGAATPSEEKILQMLGVTT